MNGAMIFILAFGVLALSFGMHGDRDRIGRLEAKHAPQVEQHCSATGQET